MFGGLQGKYKPLELIRLKNCLLLTATPLLHECLGSQIILLALLEVDTEDTGLLLAIGE